MLETCERMLAALLDSPDLSVSHFWHARLPTAKPHDKTISEESMKSERSYKVVPQELLTEVLMICRQSLGLPHLGADDNFFDLGRDSLDCMSIAAALCRANFPVGIPQIYQSPSPRGISQSLDSEFMNRSVSSLRAHGTINDDAQLRWRDTLQGRYSARIYSVHPVAPVQRGVLERSAKCHTSRLYHDQSIIEFGESVDASAFEAAWNHVIASNPCLRSVFCTVEATNVQVVLEFAPLVVRQLDLSSLSTAARVDAIERIKAGDLGQAFDLERGPLLRVALMRYADDHFALFLSFHVILMDGWCFAFVMKEFQDAYRAIQRGVVPVVTKRSSYSEFADWTMRQDEPRSLEYWSSLLSSAKFSCDVPRLSARVAGNDYVTVSDTIPLPEIDLNRVGAYCSENQITVNSFFQACWAVLLQQLGGRNEVVFGVTVSGRPPELNGANDIIGLMFNDIPVCVRFADGIRFSELAQSLQREFGHNRQHEYVSMVDVRRSLGLAVDDELFQTLFVFENYPKEAEAELRADTSQYLRERATWRREVSEIDITAYIEIGPSGVSVRLAYLADLFSADMIANLSDRFRKTASVALDEDAVG